MAVEVTYLKDSMENNQIQLSGRAEVPDRTTP